MEIRNDLLRRVLSGPFGLNISQQNLLGNTNSMDNQSSVGNNSLTVIDEGLSQRAGRRLVAEEINKQRNIEEVIKRTDDILQKDSAAPLTNEESDQGWVEECLDGAGKAYNEDLKVYWAKLLAGEVKKPGFYSKRIINFLKSLSQKDAERVRYMCKYVLYSLNHNDAFIFRFKEADFRYSDLSFLMELRLIDSSSFVVKQFRFSENAGQAIFVKKDIGFYMKIAKKEYDMPIYSFTELGKELLSIIDDVDVDTDYLKGFAKSIVNKNNGFEIISGKLKLQGDSYFIQKGDKYFEIPEKKNEEVSEDTQNE